MKGIAALSSYTSYDIARCLVLLLLALLYLFCFVTTLPQIDSLLGADGLHPLPHLLQTEAFAISLQNIWRYPSLFWISTSSLALYGVCILGACGSVLALISRWQRAGFLLAWVSYLSIVSLGGPFFQYQWDILLLEAGFLAGLLSTNNKTKDSSPGMRAALFLLHWLVIRLIFQSAIAKILEPESLWTSGKALQFFFETQPFPAPLAYYAHRAPEELLTAITILLLACELLTPVLLLMGGRYRHYAAVSLVGIQVFFVLNGNFGHLHFLTLILILGLFDDTFYLRLLPSLHHLFPRQERPLAPRISKESPVPALLLLLFSIVLLIRQPLAANTMPRIIEKVIASIAPFRIVNSYGLLSRIEPQRLVVVVEGSNDGAQWYEILPKHYLQALNAPLRYSSPFHPRLAWQLALSATDSPHKLAWFRQFIGGLLAASPTTGSLVAEPTQKSTLQVRALIYRYEFTRRHQRRLHGTIWQRALLGVYLHPVRSATPQSADEQTLKIEQSLPDQNLDR